MRAQSKHREKITEEARLKTESGEKEFYMSLPLTVSGLDKKDQEFTEKSVLLSISSREASFILSTPVKVESTLRLVMDLPPKLSQGKKLQLVLKGTVKDVQPLAGNHGSRKVHLRLDSRYFIGEGT